MIFGCEEEILGDAVEHVGSEEDGLAVVEGCSMRIESSGSSMKIVFSTLLGELIDKSGEITLLGKDEEWYSLYFGGLVYCVGIYILLFCENCPFLTRSSFVFSTM